MPVITILKKEIASYVKCGSGFVIAGLFFLVHGIFFSMYTLHYGLTDYSYTLSALEVSFLAIIPLLTMGLAAGERSSKTDVLLFTAPLTSSEIAIGKYLATVVVAAVLTAATTVVPFLCIPAPQLFAGKTLVAALGFFLEWCAFAIVGLCVSCAAKTKISAAAVTFCWVLSFTLLDSLTLLLPRGSTAGLMAAGGGILLVAILLLRYTRSIRVAGIFAAFGALVTGFLYIRAPQQFENFLSHIGAAISVTARTKRFNAGIVDMSSITFFLTWISVWLYLSILILEKKRCTNGE